MEMGQKIAELRKEKGLTLEELGAAVGVQSSAVSKWEKGRVDNMKRETILKLAEVLGVAPSYLMGWDDNEDGYYYDPEVARMADELKNNRGMRILLDASRDLTMDELLEVIEIVNKMKRGE